jgi:urease accessory protein
LAEPVLVGVGPGAGDPQCDHRHLTARARVVVDRVGGVDRVIECWGEPPLLPRQTAAEVCFVGSAAGPLGGDVLSTTLEVGDGARLAVGTAAATYARPGAAGEESLATVEVRVGRGGRLSWMPEPLVAVSGCRHRAEAVIDLAEGAELFWAEMTVLGRHGEVGGDVWVRRSVDLAGRPLSRQEVAMVAADRTRSDPAVLGGARVVASCLVVHPEWHADPTGGEPPVPEGSEPPALVTTGATRAGVLHLAGPAAEIVGLGQSVDDVLAAFGVSEEGARMG